MDIDITKHPTAPTNTYDFIEGIPFHAISDNVAV